MSEEIKTQETTETVTETVETQEVTPEEVKTPSKNDLLRDMSKEYGVNLFDAKGLQAFKEYQESQKSEAEKRAEEIQSLNERLKQYETDAKSKDFNLAALELGIPKEKFSEAKALSELEGIKGETVSERLADVKAKYGIMFQNQGQTKQEGINISIGTQMSERENETGNTQDEALARYLKTKK